MSSNNKNVEIEVLNDVISALEKLEPEDRERIFQTVATFFHIEGRTSVRTGSEYSRSTGASHQFSPPVGYSEDLSTTPKDFLLEKGPRTDVERVTCLAYYLTHYRDMPHFKTLDLSKLNTEAAQPKFTNAAYTTNNAQKAGYLVAGTKGHRQLSAGGEQFVRALPDREAAKKAMLSFRPKRKSKKKSFKDQSSEKKNAD
jgi:hypothetical protein